MGDVILSIHNQFPYPDSENQLGFFSDQNIRYRLQTFLTDKGQEFLVFSTHA
jgi:hypothetical protein